MKIRHFVSLLLLSLSTFAQSVEDKIKIVETNLNHWDKSKTKKQSLKERMAFYNTNAVSIAVIKDYKVEWTKAYGFADVSEKRAASTHTLFQAASISKSINSLAIIKLVQEGKLALNDDINKYLKTWKFPYDSVAKGNKITIAQLLSHTAGLSIGGFGGYPKGKELPTTIETLNGLPPSNSAAVRSVFEPGLKFQYSGGGTTITQLILENVTGEKYEEYMMKNILKSLKMNESSFNQPPSESKTKLLATGYHANGKEVKDKYHIYPEKAAAGLWTKPSDLAKYIIETQLSLSGNSNIILSKELSSERINNNLGVFLNNFKGTKYFGHSGGNEGFICHYDGTLENGNGIVVMTNGRNFGLIAEVINSVASLNNWENYPIESRKESIALTISKESYNNIDKGIELYKKLKKNNNTDYNFSEESELNQLGYEFLGEGNIESAIKIFSLNILEFPNSVNVYNSRGEAYFNKKDYQSAKTDYLKVLEIESTAQNAKSMLLKIEEALKKRD